MNDTQKVWEVRSIIIKAIIAAKNDCIVEAIKLTVTIDNTQARKYLLECIEDYYESAKLDNLHIDGYPLRAKLHKLNAVTFEVTEPRTLNHFVPSLNK